MIKFCCKDKVQWRPISTLLICFIPIDVDQISLEFAWNIIFFYRKFNVCLILVKQNWSIRCCFSEQNVSRMKSRILWIPEHYPPRHITRYFRGLGALPLDDAFMLTFKCIAVSKMRGSVSKPKTSLGNTLRTTRIWTRDLLLTGQSKKIALPARVCGLLENCELLGGASKLGKCHVCTAVEESYAIVQRFAHLPGKQKVPGSNPGGVA